MHYISVCILMGKLTIFILVFLMMLQCKINELFFSVDKYRGLIWIVTYLIALFGCKLILLKVN